MTALLTMIALGALCWLFRVMFIVVLPADRLPAPARRALGHLAPSVLAALIAVELASPGTHSDTGVQCLALGALLIVAVVTWRVRSITLAVALALVAVLAIDLLAL